MKKQFSLPKWIYPGFRFKTTSAQHFQEICFYVYHRVFRKVLNHFQNIRTWRFHCRTSFPEKGGPTETKLLLYTELTLKNIKPIMLTALSEAKELQNDVLKFTDCKDQGETRRYWEITGSTTPGWHAATSLAFPRFAKDLCESWLFLVGTLEGKLTSDQDLFMEYLKLWELDGGRSFIHHLAATFLYHPTLIKL